MESEGSRSNVPREEIRAVIIGAGARGNRVFAELMRTNRIGWRVSAVVEPHPERREQFRQLHGLPADRAFESLDALLAGEKVGDVAFVCTPDITHYSICSAVSRAGYDVLLEKPIATSLPDSLALLDVEATHGNRIFVAHVLRYAPLFRTVKQIVASREYGLVRNIRLTESVGHWHFAHSYVRGNWRRQDESAPIVLTKCSHDLDIIAWLMEEDRPAFVSSFGSLEYFTRSNAPPEAAERCVDCVLQDTCRYSATRFYVHEEPGWPYDVITPVPDSTAARRRAIESGPYGRCVWKCDNDVMDNQAVTVQFESGVHASFGLYGLTADNTRNLTILLDGAELVGDLHRGRLSILELTGRKDDVNARPIPLPVVEDHHGGGDLALLRSLHEHLTTGANREVMTSLRSSIASHVLAFLAEESRMKGGSPLPVPAIFESGGKGPILPGEVTQGGAAAPTGVAEQG
ncbi:MAG TPA: Gfo/Idh/MocA family oxidoreductase [Longimicrobiales bacterium]|nr:Gfo/Idh/MocA family oxidoreductase [Longimicrobiales bacterium]